MGTYRRNYKATPWNATARIRPRYNFKRPARTALRAKSVGGPVAFGEMKYFDTERVLTDVVSVQAWTGTEMNPSTTGCFFCPVPGTGISDRVSRKALLKKIRVHGIINVDNQSNQTTADQATAVRIILVQDTQANGTQFQGEQVMDATAASSPVTAFRNLDTLGRFKVYYDQVHCIDAPNCGNIGTGANFQQGGAVRHFKISVRFKQPIVVNFNATGGGTFADIVDNNFSLVANCNNTNLAPQISFTARCYFQG